MGGMDVWIHILLTSALVGGEWSASLPDRFTSDERAPDTHWIGGWVGPRTGLDDVDCPYWDSRVCMYCFLCFITLSYSHYTRKGAVMLGEIDVDTFMDMHVITTSKLFLKCCLSVMRGSVEGWAGGWMDGWVGGWVTGWMGGWVDGWI
jgi:hypothetical protein